MGFEIAGSGALLDFEEGTLLHGAQVRVSLEMRIRDFMALQRAIAELDEDAESINLEQWEHLFREFARTSLLSWDLEDHGQPIDATEDGFMTLPFSVANAIFQAWVLAIGGTSPKQNAVSANGVQSEAGFEGMVPA